MIIRAEIDADQDAIHALNCSAFATADEARLVDTLRKQVKTAISLVAEMEDTIVGHIMLTPVTLSGHEATSIMGLAPMAVCPEHQGTGIGSQLVRSAIDICRKKECAAIAVLGHPDYYPRFGFRPAVQFDIKCEYDVPDDVFMIMELAPDSLRDKSGTVRYHEAFGGL